jgi:hypothetical protein
MPTTADLEGRFQIQWSEVEIGALAGGLRARGRALPRARRGPARSDPLNAHLGAPECEFAAATDPAVLRVILKVKDGAGGDYHWVECGACDTAWQVPYYAESVG